MYIYMNLPSSTELLMETPTGVPEYSSEEVLLTTYSVEKKILLVAANNLQSHISCMYLALADSVLVRCLLQKLWGGSHHVRDRTLYHHWFQALQNLCTSMRNLRLGRIWDKAVMFCEIFVLNYLWVSCTKLLAAVCILEVFHTYQVVSNLIPMCAFITTFSFFFSLIQILISQAYGYTN